MVQVVSYKATRFQKVSRIYGMNAKPKYLYTKKSVAAIIGVDHKVIGPKDLPNPIRIGRRTYYRLPDLSVQFPGLFPATGERSQADSAPVIDNPENHMAKAKRTERRNIGRGKK